MGAVESIDIETLAHDVESFIFISVEVLLDAQGSYIGYTFNPYPANMENMASS
jgi:hypothetical protein